MSAVAQKASQTGTVGDRRILAIDLIRLFAAVLVMLYHFGFWHWTRTANLLSSWFNQPSPLGDTLHFGWVGVEIFFVISGFVIAYSAEGATASKFARSRVLRLAPAVWVCATLALLIYIYSLHRAPATELIAYAASIFFIPLRYIDDVYWTLSIEICFYIFVYVLIRRGRLALLERLMVGVGLASGLFWVAALSLQYGLEGRSGWLATLRQLVIRAEGNRLLQFGLVQHGCLFALGVVIHRWSSVGETRKRLLVMGVLTVACMAEILGQNGIISRAAHRPLSPFPAMAIWLGAVGFMLLAIRFERLITSRLSQAWRAAIGFMGQITFPLYLIHNSVGLSVTAVLAPWLGPASVLVGVAVAVVAACLIELFPERWVRAALRRILDGGQSKSLGHTRAGSAAFSIGADNGT